MDVTDNGGSTLTGIGKTTVTVTDATWATPARAGTQPSAPRRADHGALDGGDASRTPTQATTTRPTSPRPAARPTIHWGDGQTSTGTVSYSAGTYSVTGSHTYADETPAGHPYAVTVDVSDDGGSRLLGIGQTTVAVADANLTDTSSAVAATSTEGASTGTIVVATFTDANPGDNTEDFTATIHWGDGQTSTGTVGYSGGDSTASRAATLTPMSTAWAARTP